MALYARKETAIVRDRYIIYWSYLIPLNVYCSTSSILEECYNNYVLDIFKSLVRIVRI